jgi:hypothetical protein
MVLTEGAILSFAASLVIFSGRITGDMPSLKVTISEALPVLVTALGVTVITPVLLS